MGRPRPLPSPRHANPVYTLNCEEPHVHVGDPLTVAGTVKAHTEWHGIKQTVLTRPKQLDTTPEPALPSLADAAAPARWETVPSVRLDGADAAQRSTTTRTPSRGVAVSY